MARKAHVLTIEERRNKSMKHLKDAERVLQWAIENKRSPETIRNLREMYEAQKKEMENLRGA